MDVDVEREKIAKEIEELERILDPSSSTINGEVSESSLGSDSEGDLLLSEDSDAPSPPVSEEERWGDISNDEDDPKDRNLPEDPETCLQLNMVYQEVIREKITEVTLLLAQNQQQQEEITWELAGSKGPKVKDGKGLPSNVYIGHFMKPYFKDRVTGVGPPANEDTREKAAQGIKSFEQLLVTKWKNWEKTLLRKSVVSDRLQRLLQPKLLKLEYLQQKQSKAAGEPERQVLEKQIQEAEKDIQEINQLPEEALLGHRLDSHDWEKISNINFEGGRSAEEIRKFWQNCEHPSINKQEWSREEIELLKEVSARHGHLEWQKIAAELGTNRGAFQCLQKFQQHNKGLKRSEWTEEEDRLLSQLVQEMRVGSHIPYRRIVYYMEGRDSMQLIYRWTKSLDPGLKKGFWAPEEDAKLLQAVAKYGEHDWFKIREEVPGRSDAQCRDRYVRRLYCGLKKGRWNSKEEEKLIELIEKHGVGHWAKIASELPHRTGSQCLSKWKILMRKGQSHQHRRRRPRQRARWSSSSSGSSGGSGESSSSSSSSEDSETELEEGPGVAEDGTALPLAEYVVPNVDLWVPARQRAHQPWTAAAGGWPGHSAGPPKEARATHGGSKEASGSDLAPREDVSLAQAPTGLCSSVLRGIWDSRSTDTHPACSELLEDKGGKCLLKVPPETVLRVLRANTATRCRKQKEKLRQPPPPGSPLVSGPGSTSAGNPVLRPWPTSSPRGQRRRRHTLQRRLLDRQLLMAVSPWVGDITLPRAQAPRRPPGVQTRADNIRMQLQGAQLASTPVFALFIQLLQIDTDGCMQVIRERRAQPPTAPQAGSRHLARSPLQVPLSAQNAPGCVLPRVPARVATKKSTSHQGDGGPGACRSEAVLKAPLPAPSGPRPKPKTVSELLREKRLREARARKAVPGPVVLSPQILLSSPLILQSPLPPAPQRPPATGPALSSTVLPGLSVPTLASPKPSGCSSLQEAETSARQERPPALQVPHPSSTPPSEASASTPALGPSQMPVSCVGQSQAPATCRKQGLPEPPLFLPAAPSPTQLPVQPLSLMPALGQCRGAPLVRARPPLPITWVLTAQGLLPVSVPAMGDLPRPEQPGGTPKVAPELGLLAQGPSVALPPARTETPGGPRPWTPTLHHPREPPADLAPAALSRTDPSQSPAGVDSDVACAPRELSPTREATAAPVPPDMPSQTMPPGAHPETETPSFSQPLLHSGACPSGGTGGVPGLPTGTGQPRGPLVLGPTPQPGADRRALDLSLISQESVAAAQEWLRGWRGVRVPPLGNRLPYQPPALGSLRTLAGLLLHKKALECRAATLAGSGEVAGHEGCPPAAALQASLGLVQGQLRDSPAYLLLKTRFLAAFTLPALLATLPPRGVHTTLSIIASEDSESEDGDFLGELEAPDRAALQHGQPSCVASPPQLESQETLNAGKGFATSCLETSDDLDVLRTRRSRHVRKRRRLM
ncbi:snRNA-activating protein complex subunit 4 isoform X2 [Choloepus didactylus]|nr:snRNA-activating protein complex subunit 4 isoform X2 [Choloepus didactylus]XP_037653270.1 snRNA-activating protein complex subunit 4 isoform X2 [Choloepus didactylus]